MIKTFLIKILLLFILLGCQLDDEIIFDNSREFVGRINYNAEIVDDTLKTCTHSEIAFRADFLRNLVVVDSSDIMVRVDF